MLIYIIASWKILQTFGYLCVHLVHFSRFWKEKSGNPGQQDENNNWKKGLEEEKNSAFGNELGNKFEPHGK
jgi:endo-beta-N-acetylglucosaminidase D